MKFDIPDNDGILPLGIGTLGLIKGKIIEFYIYQNNQWTLAPNATFEEAE